MKILKYVLYGIIAIFFLIQFVPNELPENNNDLTNDIILIEKASEEVKLILSKACYDCHSNQTNYPWYSYVAPVSWLVAKDIRHGREELNFSDWSELSKRKKIKILSEMAEEIEKKSMPLEVYTFIHKDAILTEEEVNTIISWTETVSSNILGE